jgi:hypothetical protein
MRSRRGAAITWSGSTRTALPHQRESVAPSF